MLYEIMRSIRNFFLTEERHEGEYTVEDGVLSLSFAEEGDYVLIHGSQKNDGVYRYPITDLDDGIFSAEICLLAPPRDFLTLCEEITEWQKKSVEMGANGQYLSESFGGYSYTRPTNGSGGMATWQDVFRTRLNAWRKI